MLQKYVLSLVKGLSLKILKYKSSWYRTYVSLRQREVRVKVEYKILVSHRKKWYLVVKSGIS